MSQLNIDIRLDNVIAEVDANTLGDLIESIIQQNTGINDVQMNIYDQDGQGSSNPIFLHDTHRKIK